MRSRVTSLAVEHPVDTEDRRVWLTGGAIDVEENGWIGAGATILPAVTIGRDSVVEAGAVVAADIAPSTLVTGAVAAVWGSGADRPSRRK